MEITRLSELKPRTVWEITDDAFDLYRERFALLASVSAIVFAPTFVLMSTAGVAIFRDFKNVFDGPESLGLFALNMLWFVPALFGSYIVQFAATAIAVRDVLTGESATVLNVYQRTFRRFFSLLFASISISLVGLVSACTWIGPLVVAAYYCFTAHGIVLEERKLGDSIKRSRDMAKSYFWKSFGLLCLMAVITLALIIGIKSIVALGESLLPSQSGIVANAESEKVSNLIATVLVAVAAVLIAPLPAIATTLLYYDLRVRREGLDIEFEAQAWGIPLAPDPFGGILNPTVPKVKGNRKP